MNKNVGLTNIEYLTKAKLCTGCGTCLAVCPVKCIQMIKDEDKGVYIPQIDNSKCLNCGICLKVCPGYFVDFDSLNLQIFEKIPRYDMLGNYINSYIAYATDYKIRYNSSSGGVVTALLSFMLEEGIIDCALVTMMDEEKPLEPKFIFATNKHEIIPASGSKYCPVPLNMALTKIIDLPRKFAVVGLPCHIHGIRKFENINEELKKKIVIHLGLYCANTTNFLGTEYFLSKYGIAKEDVKKISYRGEGWPGMIRILTKNGAKYRIRRGPSERNLLYKAIFSSAFHYDFIPYRCLLCPDQTNELSDISFGDAWLRKLLQTENPGFSIIISRTEKGQEILNKAIEKEIIKLTKISKSTLLRAGNFYFKASVGGRIHLMRLLGKATPYFLKRGLYFRLSIVNCLYTLQYLPSFVSEKKFIWPFLAVIALFRAYMAIPISFLIKFKSNLA